MGISEITNYLGATIIALVIIYLFYYLRPMKLKIRKYIPRLAKKGSKRPVVEHLLEFSNSYQVYVTLPDTIDTRSFSDRKEALEHYLEVPVEINIKEDVLVLDIPKRKKLYIRIFEKITELI
ncbi:MAG: hypothetical protein LRY71_16730 [Bacillaceae bacterium]|nr:hypothetical protein [Bacillaceae bacterium]